MDIECREPFDFGLSLRAMKSFGLAHPQAGVAAAEPVLRMGVRLGGVPTLLLMRQRGPSSAVMTAEARPAAASPASLRDMAARVLNADLDLQPFYDLAAGHPVMGPLTRALHGLKGFRPAAPFDMLVIAVIEQQISLMAAHHIRGRLVARFGAEVEGEPVFPDGRRARGGLAGRTHGLRPVQAQGRVRVGPGGAKSPAGSSTSTRWKRRPATRSRERIMALRGFGPWSADYFLIRGLARPDALPADDLGIRTIVGKMLGDGSRPSAAQVATLLAPLAPYRGLAAFYLLVDWRRHVP